VYQTVVFLLESAVFGLIGLQLPALLRGLTDLDPRWPLQAVVIAVTLMVVRVAWVFPLAAIRRQRQEGERLSWRVPAVVSWAGTRGVVPLAAALSIPLTLSNGTALPERDVVLLLTITVIVITLVVQGFTLAPLVRYAGIALAEDDVRDEHTAARLQLAHAGLSHLDHLTETETAPEFVIEALRASWRNRIERIQEHRNSAAPQAASIYRQLRRDLLDVENAELDRLYHDGAISDTTRRQIQRSLDLEHARLGEGP
jgi:CPA1 family monovalent cation:H+ antiporter